MNQETQKHMISLTTLEPFRIGAPESSMGSAHNPLSTVGGRVVVPASSLKGALRAELEGYLIKTKKHSDNPYMKPCIPSAWNTISDAEKNLIKEKKFKDGGGCNYSVRSSSDYICPVCYFLGAQGLIGFVRVPYLYTDSSAEKLYSVRIDRASGVVSERTNRDYRIVPDGTEFISKSSEGEIPLEIIIRDEVKDWTLGKPRKGFNDRWLENNNQPQEDFIKEFITDRLAAIDILGGFKSKGCGKVRIEVK